MEGFDDQPTIVAKHEMQPLSYTHPHSGEYVFHMSIIDVMTGEEVNSIAIKIVVDKLFYEYWWFWPAVAAAVILVIILIVSLYAPQNGKGSPEGEGNQGIHPADDPGVCKKH